MYVLFFITNVDALNEMSQVFNSLNAVGFPRYVKMYKDMYNWGEIAPWPFQYFHTQDCNNIYKRRKK